MKLRYTIFFSMLLLARGLSAAVADSITVNGEVIPESGTSMAQLGTQVQLFAYKQPGGAAFYTKVNDEGKFSFRLQLDETTLFEIKYKNYRLNLVLSPGEPVCHVSIRSNDHDATNMTTIDSRENEAYNKYFRRTNNALKEALKGAQNECADDDKACAAKLKSIAALHNLKMEYIGDKYKGTYAAAIAPMAELPVPVPAKNALSYMRLHFFDGGDYADLKLYGTPDLGERITMYLDYMADTAASARLAFITALIQKAKSGSEAEKELISLLLGNFMNGDRENYLQSLVQWGATRPKLSDEQPVMAAKIALLAKVIPGGTAPEVLGTDTGDNPKSLLGTITANKLSLLIFWESDCPHCRKAMPEFIRLYRKYHPLGLGVFAASMDIDVQKWKQYINANNLVWDNALLPEKTSVHADYFIQYTPTVVLIDKRGIIVRRFIAVNDLDKNIAAILGN